MTATQTKPETIDTTTDKRKRHYVERLTPKGVKPPLYSKIALCGEEVEEIVVGHSAEICQTCIDEARRRPVEK